MYERLQNEIPAGRMASEIIGEIGLDTAKYSDGHLNVLMCDLWVPANALFLVEKEFVNSPIAKIPPGGYKSDLYSKSRG